MAEEAGNQIKLADDMPAAHEAPSPSRRPYVIQTRRIGRFSIPVHFIDNSPAEVKALLASVIVVQAQATWPAGQIQYVALCEQFDAVPENIQPPLYMAEMLPVGSSMILKGWKRISPPMAGEEIVPAGTVLS